MKAANVARFVCLAALAAAAGGCAVADTGAFSRLQDEMVALKKEVAAMKSSSASLSSAPGSGETGDVSSLQRNVADLSASQDQVKSELLAATTRADEMKVQVQRDIARLNGKVAVLEEKMERLAAGAPASSAASAPTPQDWKSPEEMYDYALGLIKSGDTRKGRQILTSFAAKYPDHKLLPNVYYWKGETFYVEKDYENAILSFQDVVDRYPGGDKAPDAMYKQGLSFLALKDQKNARILFELVQSKYPKSAVAPLARQRIAELR